MDRILDNYLNLQVLGKYGPDILGGFWVTLQVTVLTVTAGIGAGLGLALLRCLHNRSIDALIAIYVDVFRTLPQLVVIIFVYFGLPYAGIRLSPFVTTVLSLAVVLSAFAAEIFWAAIMAVPKGQWDAAQALGFGLSGTLFLVVLPQAVRIAIPLLTNRAISITKGTALGTAVALPEILGRAQSAMALAANPSPLTLAAALYLVFFLPLIVMSRWLEGRYGWGG